MDPSVLSRRERQIMEVLYARQEATALEVLADLPDPPGRTAVRTLLRILEEKGHVRHRQNGREFIYRPIQKRQRAGRSALERVLATFFGGSLTQALEAHLADPKSRLSAEELKRLTDLIERARNKES